MEQYLRDNESYFLKQVASYKFPPTLENTEQKSSISDTIIASRIRPIIPHETEQGEIVGSSVDATYGCAAIHELRRKVNGQPALNSSTFHVDRVYGPDQDSRGIYGDIVKPLIPWAWSGGISTLFAYGQTGSGKTHSINQIEELVAGDLMGGDLGGNRDVYVCVFELIGNNAFDLLNDRHRISIMEDSFGESQLVGAVEQKPSTSQELLSLIEQSMKFRKSAPTLKNDTSSRSHAICRVRITNKDVIDAPDGLLFLVDLAGSEFSSDVKEHSDERRKETREINVSLATLKDCIRGRALWNISESAGISSTKAPKVHIPFRSSALTKVLKHVFDVKGDRHCKTAILACVKPTASDAGPSKNALRYAEMLRVPVPPTKPVKSNPMVPSTWPPVNLAAWIHNNSGDPPISHSHLAPTESGSQLIKLPKAEFVTRCLKTENVTPEQARAFYDKLWRLHIDSRSSKKESQTGDSTPEQEPPAEPFQNRIRPGMIVLLKQPERKYPSNGARHVAILCPEGAFEEEKSKDVAGSKRYICAEINPSVMADAYNLALRRQSVVALEDMEKEVLMEFDGATRFYFMNI